MQSLMEPLKFGCQMFTPSTALKGSPFSNGWTARNSWTHPSLSNVCHSIPQNNAKRGWTICLTRFQGERSHVEYCGNEKTNLQSGMFVTSIFCRFQLWDITHFFVKLPKLSQDCAEWLSKLFICFFELCVENFLILGNFRKVLDLITQGWNFIMCRCVNGTMWAAMITMGWNRSMITGPWIGWSIIFKWHLSMLGN